jgi:hypothetical protein
VAEERLGVVAIHSAAAEPLVAARIPIRLVAEEQQQTPSVISLPGSVSKLLERLTKAGLAPVVFPFDWEIGISRGCLSRFC